MVNVLYKVPIQPNRASYATGVSDVWFCELATHWTNFMTDDLAGLVI